MHVPNPLQACPSEHAAHAAPAIPQEPADCAFTTSHVPAAVQHPFGHVSKPQGGPASEPDARASFGVASAVCPLSGKRWMLFASAVRPLSFVGTLRLASAAPSGRCTASTPPSSWPPGNASPPDAHPAMAPESVNSPNSNPNSEDECAITLKTRARCSGSAESTAHRIASLAVEPTARPQKTIRRASARSWQSTRED